MLLLLLLLRAAARAKHLVLQLRLPLVRVACGYTSV
jgi:hypothetical protein